MKILFQITGSIFFLSYGLIAQISRDSVYTLLKKTDEHPSNFNKNYRQIQQTIKWSVQNKDTQLLILSYQKMGDILWYKSMYGQAEDYYFNSLKLIDSARYPKEFAYALYSVGWIECVQKNKTENLSLLKRALKISHLLKDINSVCVISNAISGAYMSLYAKDTNQSWCVDSAINVLVRAIQQFKAITKKDNDITQLEINLATEYVSKRDYNAALPIVNSVLSKCSNSKMANRNFYFYSTLLLKTKILYYLHIKDSVNYLLHKYRNAFEQIEDPETQMDFYEFMYKVEKDQRRYLKSLEYFEKYHALYDKTNKELWSVKYEELEANKELFKKEQSILALQKQTEIQNIKNKQKTYVIIFAGVVILIIAYLLYKSLYQNRLIKNLHREVSMQKNILEQKNKDILDSINYASRIQRALITSDEYIQKHFVQTGYFQNYFIVYLPKDIVSGDFYWANANITHPKQPHYLAVCDSTGHGVPGAFMSLLNINYLTEAVQEKQLYYPHDILLYVRNKLIQNLTYDERQKDGMDASLLLFDEEYKKNKTIFYALANHHIIIARHNREIETLTGDKMPVGFSHHQQPFRLFSVELQKHDWIYLLTDGYKDQFGGKKGKRIMNKQVLEIINRIRHLQPQDQKNYLYQFFIEWKGQTEQTDDITIFAFQV